ncbi:proteoglycan 4 isoform X3 [Nasonia vitripennis]|uniref:ARID domain-containing protein n=1 Tax=Nasonia vitripennis TaxID=7425 RepID=A0A7M7QJ22_NASVI|nr:proteoglycan 4 isoform X3 [Nasonia vitripennis]
MAIIMTIRENRVVELKFDKRKGKNFCKKSPKLKGRPRRKRKKRSVSPAGESSNESEASVASSAAASTSKGSTSSSGQSSGRPSAASSVRRSERKVSAEEKRFLDDIYGFMSSRNTPIGKMPLLGYRQIDLFLFYTKVHELGGYDKVSLNRLWKTIYDEMGGNTGSTSAATITRRHYERLLLPYERYQKGEETKVRPSQGGRRAKTPSTSDVSEDSVEVKRENESPPLSVTPPPSEASNSTATPPPLQSILSTSPFLPGDKPGKTSSLRSVRVKPERLKSLNTIIATSNPVQPANQQQLPSSPTSLLTATANTTTSSSAASSPTSTPPAPTTPTNPSAQHSVLERQLNSPLITHQVPPACSPPGLPVSTVATNATTVVTLTPPPEKDMKEIKLDPKQTSLLAQGKENIPLFEEKSAIFTDKTLVAPRSPEVIDLETETEPGTRDKLIIPSFKKRKLEILREGGLEVTAVDLEYSSILVIDARPSVIQPTATTSSTTSVSSSATTTTSTSSSSTSTTTSPSPLTIPTITASIVPPMKQEDGRSSASPDFALPQPAVIPKLINVTVTPDIGNIMPRSSESPQQPVTPVKCQPNSLPNSGESPTGLQTSPTANSRVINLGNNSNNATLLQLYANANVPVPHSLAAAAVQTNNHRFVPPHLPNGRPPIPHKVTQSRSIFGNNEKMVYGNPKDILVAPKFVPAMVTPPHIPRAPSILSAPNVRCGSSGSSMDANTSGVLDLTQKPSAPNERPTYGRPNLEIVRVPVVPRPTPLNLETRNHHQYVDHQPHYPRISVASNLCKEVNTKPPAQSQAERKNQFVTGSVPPSPVGYANVLDSRTMATNNLEITLVSPKKTAVGNAGPPQLSPPLRNNNVMPPSVPVQRRQQQQQQLNGKFPTRLPAEPVSPYTPRKPASTNSGPSIQHPVIPNIPNLSHLNAGSSSNYGKSNHIGNYQHMAIEKRRAAEAASKEHQRRTSESDKIALQLQQQQQQQQQQRLEATSAALSKQQQSRDAETSRRHSVPSIPTGFIPTMPASSPFPYLAHQLATASASNDSSSSSTAAAAAALDVANFVPTLDPMYYSAFYNSLFARPMGPARAAPNAAFLQPEISAYCKELFASSSAQQTRLAMAAAAGQQHQPAAPTSK